MTDRESFWWTVAIIALIFICAWCAQGCSGLEFQQGAEDDGSLTLGGGGAADVDVRGAAGLRGDVAAGGAPAGGSAGGLSGSAGDAGGQQGGGGGSAGAAGDVGGGAGNEARGPVDCSMLPVWVDDEPLPLQAGGLVQSHGFAYRALREVRYAISGCDPFEPVDCDWFILEGECDGQKAN